MPKKIKKHLLNFLSVTGVYISVVAGIVAYKILMGSIAETEGIQTVEQMAGVIYFLICIWFCWRFYTGIFRDGDFLD